jgi:hypothetical protein
VEWLDEVARVCGWSREQAAQQALSEGRRVLSLQLARRPAGRWAGGAVAGVGAAVGLDAGLVEGDPPDCAEVPADLEDAPVPA